MNKHIKKFYVLVHKNKVLLLNTNMKALCDTLPAEIRRVITYNKLRRALAETPRVEFDVDGTSLWIQEMPSDEELQIKICKQRMANVIKGRQNAEMLRKITDEQLAYNKLQEKRYSIKSQIKPKKKRGS